MFLFSDITKHVACLVFKQSEAYGLFCGRANVSSKSKLSCVKTKRSLWTRLFWCGANVSCWKPKRSVWTRLSCIRTNLSSETRLLCCKTKPKLMEGPPVLFENKLMPRGQSALFSATTKLMFCCIFKQSEAYGLFCFRTDISLETSLFCFKTKRSLWTRPFCFRTT